MDFLNRKLIAVLEGMRKEIISLRESIDASRDQQERYNQQQQAQRELPQPSIRVDAEIHEKPDPAGKKKPSSERQLTVQRVIAVGTWCAFIAAAIYAGYARSQLRTMDATYWQVEQQTRILQQQLSGTQGAVLNIEAGMQEYGFIVDIKNLRPVSAKHVNGTVEISRITLPGMKVVGSPRQIAFSVPVLSTANEFNQTYPVPIEWTEEKWEKVSPPYSFMIKVDFSYDDGFGNPISNHFCQAQIPIITIRNINGAMVKTGGLYPCDDFVNSIKRWISLKRDEANGIYH